MGTFNFKNITIIANIIILFCVLTFSFCQKQKIDNIINSINLLGTSFNNNKMQEELKQKDSIISVIKEQDKIAYNILLREYHAETIKKNNQTEEFKKLQNLLLKYGVNLSNLNSNLQIVVKKVDSTLVTLIPQTADSTDLITNYNFSDSISHLKINGNIDIKNNKMFFGYKYNATYNILTYKESQKWFKEPILRATIESDDPNSELSFQSIFIKNQKAKCHIGVGIGESVYYQNGIKFASTIQIGVYIPVLSIY